MLFLWIFTVTLSGLHIQCSVGVDKQLQISRQRLFPPKTSRFLQPYNGQHLSHKQHKRTIQQQQARPRSIGSHVMTKKHVQVVSREFRTTPQPETTHPTTITYIPTTVTTEGEPTATTTAGPPVFPSKPPLTTTRLTTASPEVNTTVIHFIDECPDPADFHNCTGFSSNHSRDGVCFYFLHNETLNCEGAKLTQLPKGIPTNVRTLLLSGNHIMTINRWTFAAFTSVLYLDLCYGWLHQVGTNTFSYMKSLEHLQIMQHHAQLEVGSLAFYDLPRLVSLRIGPIQDTTLQTVLFDLRNSRLELLGLYDINFDDLRKTTFEDLQWCPLATLEIYISEINLLDALAFSEISNLNKIIISKTGIAMVNRDAFIGLSTLHFLNLTQCSIKYLSSGTFDSLKALELLNLNGNLLQTLPVDLFKYNKNLKHIDLSNNLLTTLPNNLFDYPPDIYIDLSTNFFTCDCDLDWVSPWLDSLKNQKVNKNVPCHLPLEIRGLKLADFKPVCIPAYTWYILSISLGLIAMGTVISLLYIHRWKIYYRWYIMLSKRKDREVWMNHARFAFDAFVAYSERDFQWVLHELIPNMEDNAGPPHIKLCVSDRDWDLGSTILDNVESSIQRSRKTLCIISSHFLKSEWCKLEMSMAHMQLFSDNRDVLVFVFLEKIPSSRLSQNQRLRRELCKKSCLDWPGKNPNAQRLFWERLRSLTLKPHCESLPAVQF